MQIDGWDLPSNPYAFYKYSGWTNWGDFFGTGKRFRSIDEWVKIAEQLADEYNEVLPNSKWLKKNGYSGLDQIMRKRPELFAHIQQDKPHSHHKSPEQWAETAERLAVDHDGVLPSSEWLKKNGYAGLDRAMRKRPDLFSHIPQQRRGSKTHPITKESADAV